MGPKYVFKLLFNKKLLRIQPSTGECNILILEIFELTGREAYVSSLTYDLNYKQDSWHLIAKEDVSIEYLVLLLSMTSAEMIKWLTTLDYCH
jgi:hypothetical protein